MPSVWREQLIMNGMDAQGEEYQTWVPLARDLEPALGALNDVVTTLQALSCTAILVVGTQTAKPLPAVTTDGPYATSRDRAVIIFRTTAGTTIQVHIPGPVASMFKDGTNDVDFENVDVQAFVTACVTHLSDQAGNGLLTAVQGYRMRAER